MTVATAASGNVCRSMVFLMTMAMMAIDNTKEFMNLYQLIYQMQSK